jgi:hypothetical protein
MRVSGQLVAVDTPVVIHDLSRTGFAVVSQRAFDAGQTLDFQLAGDGGSPFTVTARAVHSRPMPNAPGYYLSGFMFIPGRLMGLVPQALIDRLIETVTGNRASLFI